MVGMGAAAPTSPASASSSPPQQPEQQRLVCPRARLLLAGGPARRGTRFEEQGSGVGRNRLVRPSQELDLPAGCRQGRRWRHGSRRRDRRAAAGDGRPRRRTALRSKEEGKDSPSLGGKGQEEQFLLLLEGTREERSDRGGIFAVVAVVLFLPVAAAAYPAFEASSSSPATGKQVRLRHRGNESPPVPRRRKEPPVRAQGHGPIRPSAGEVLCR